MARAKNNVRKENEPVYAHDQDSEFDHFLASVLENILDTTGLISSDL